MIKRDVPFWSIRAQQKMLECGINKKQLATELKINYTQLINVMRGVVINDNIEKAIKAYFNL